MTKGSSGKSGSGKSSSGGKVGKAGLPKEVVKASREVIAARRKQDDLDLGRVPAGDDEKILNKIERESGFKALQKTLERQGAILEQKATSIKEARVDAAKKVALEKKAALENALVKSGLVKDKSEIAVRTLGVIQDPTDFSKYLQGRNIEVSVGGKLLAVQKGALTREGGAPGKIEIKQLSATRLPVAEKK